VLETYQGHSDFVFALCFDSSFNLYSTGFDGTIKKWNILTRKVAYSFESRFLSVTSLAASGPILLVGLRGGGIISYNIQNSYTFNVIHVNRQSVSSLQTVNGSVYGAGLDGLLVKFPEFPQRNISIIYNSRNETLRSLVLDSRFLILLSGENKVVFFSNDQIVKTVYLQTTVICIAATEKSLLAGSRPGSVFSWTIESFELEFELKGHFAPVNNILVVDQRVFSASDDKTIIEWSLQEKASKNVYKRLSASALGHLGPVNALSYCFGLLFSAGSDLSVRSWNTQTKKHEDVYFGFSKAVTSVLCHNSSIFAGSEDFAVLMFRASFSDIPQAATSSRGFSTTKIHRRTRIIQKSQSIGSDGSSIQRIFVGLAVSLLFLLSLVSILIYRKSSSKNNYPEINSSSVFDTNTAVIDLRTVVNSVMGISKHASYLIPSSMIAGIRKLASGGGGELLIAKIMDSSLQKKFGDTVIQKIVFVRNKSSEEAFFQEVGIMIMLSHFPHFCQIIGYTERPLSLILKFYPDGSLFEWLKTSEGALQYDVKILKELAEALRTMHSHYLAHCDIKSQNVLMQVDNGVPSCYLTDFGITQILSEDILASKAFNVINLRGLSVHYASPEAFNNFRSKAYFRTDFKKYDIYSFACVVFEVQTRKMPWH
jgi:WD40 repeat protein